MSRQELISIGIRGYEEDIANCGKIWTVRVRGSRCRPSLGPLIGFLFELQARVEFLLLLEDLFDCPVSWFGLAYIFGESGF